MNIALPALVVFLLLLPEFIFRARFKLAERTSHDLKHGAITASVLLGSVA
jgi:hypothetical protein